MRWYYKFMGEVVGPLSPSELTLHVRQGRVLSETLVRVEDSRGLSKWMPAKKINGLLPETPLEATFVGRETAQKNNIVTEDADQPWRWWVVIGVCVAIIIFYFCCGATQ